MKIIIDHNSQDDIYTVQIYDGPDGIDRADFVCGSLGDCFEEIMRFRVFNGLTYSEDPKESIKSYFTSLN